ncbi:MAG: glycosyltransferase family 39 protein [Chloroflexi bacterium]|nr:glycosyltransferase family 39 protein [Chloroflexota bacterium]
MRYDVTSHRTLGFTAFAIVLAVAGEWMLLDSQNIPVAIICYGAALASLLLALLADRPAPATFALLAPANPPFTKWRWVLLAASIVCTVLAFTLNTDQSFRVEGIAEYQFTSAGVAAWFLGIILFVSAFWQPEKSLGQWREILSTKASGWSSGFSIRLSWTQIALAAILALGIFSYFYRIDVVPAEMTSDHAEKLLDVNDVLHGATPVFFIRNTGREPFQFYLTFAIIRLTGIPLSHLALKLGTAFVGWLTISAAFLLAREMFGPLVGLVAAFFQAVFHWALSISRMGLRYPFTPFFAALSLYFLWRALKYQKRNDYLVAGALLGAGLYGYIPSRDTPLVAIGVCAVWFIVDGWRRLQDWRPFAANVGLMVATLVVVFAPLLRYSLDFPGMFWYRALTRVASVEHPIEGSVPAILTRNVANLALSFNWRGDEVWPTNVPYDPTLDRVSAGLFVLGIGIAVFRSVRDRSASYVCLLAAFVALILPSALSIAFPRENPSLVRMGGALPFTAILVGLPVAQLGRSLRQSLARTRAGGALAALGVVLVLAPIVVLNYHWYFVEYDNSYRLSAQNSSEVAAVIRDFADSFGDLQHAYFVGYPYWIDGRAIAIDLGDLAWKNYSLDARDLVSDASTNRLYILNTQDADNLHVLRSQYPDGQVRIIHSRTPGKDFVSFFVPASAAQ